jgi:hypothetical protein
MNQALYAHMNNKRKRKKKKEKQNFPIKILCPAKIFYNEGVVHIIL